MLDSEEGSTDVNPVIFFPDIQWNIPNRVMVAFIFHTSIDD